MAATISDRIAVARAIFSLVEMFERVQPPGYAADPVYVAAKDYAETLRKVLRPAAAD